MLGFLIICLPTHSKRIKIKVNTQMQADTPAQEIATRQSVDEDRKLFLQVGIGRL